MLTVGVQNVCLHLVPDNQCIDWHAGSSKHPEWLQDHQDIGDFIGRQPESKRSVRLSEVRSLAWAQLQHNCRLEVRVIWKLQPPHYKQVCTVSLMRVCMHVLVCQPPRMQA